MFKVKEQFSFNQERDAIESYFECVTACSLGDEGVECVTRCIEVHLKQEESSDLN